MKPGTEQRSKLLSDELVSLKFLRFSDQRKVGLESAKSLPTILVLKDSWSEWLHITYRLMTFRYGTLWDIAIQ